MRRLCVSTWEMSLSSLLFSFPSWLSIFWKKVPFVNRLFQVIDLCNSEEQGVMKFYPLSSTVIHSSIIKDLFVTNERESVRKLRTTRVVDLNMFASIPDLQKSVVPRFRKYLLKDDVWDLFETNYRHLFFSSICFTTQVLNRQVIDTWSFSKGISLPKLSAAVPAPTTPELWSRL